jgi:hypothetical protein
VGPDQLQRIEDKLDRIIRFFNIDQEPRRSNHEIDQLVEQTIFDLNKRRNMRRKKA